MTETRRWTEAELKAREFEAIAREQELAAREKPPAASLNRAARRRALAARKRHKEWPPLALSMIRGRTDYDPDAASQIAKVEVDGIEVINCAAYDMKGRVATRRDGSRVYGHVKVTLK
jgi:hypothetical protein